MGGLRTSASNTHCYPVEKCLSRPFPLPCLLLQESCSMCLWAQASTDSEDLHWLSASASWETAALTWTTQTSSQPVSTPLRHLYKVCSWHHTYIIYSFNHMSIDSTVCWNRVISVWGRSDAECRTWCQWWRTCVLFAGDGLRWESWDWSGLARSRSWRFVDSYCYVMY